MNKKKHQNDPNEGESTESCDENDNITHCDHINRSVDLAKIKKSLIRTGIATDCEQCLKMPPATSTSDAEMNGEFIFDESLWLCLRCGNQACGRSRNQHAIAHYKTPHSDSHALCVDTSRWSVWCYECNDDVNASAKKKLLEAVEYLQKQAESKKNASKLPSEPTNSGMELVLLDTSYTHTNTTNTFAFPTTLPRPRGLTNLGNTCFFNSVVQCLTQTPYILPLLNETAKPGQYFKLPGGPLNPTDAKTEQIVPLEGTVGPWRTLTSTLAETITELQNGRHEAYCPRTLLARFTNRMPQFGGGDQHDSHELLRHLLEAVREEDSKRYQAVILEKMGFNTKTDPSSVDDEKRKILRYYGQQASEQLTPTEQVFRGVLVSTLQCQECQHTSHRDEFFLDLSLPITEKQVPPVLRRKADEIEDNKPSKHQIKKEKRAERKKNKKQKHGARNLNMTIGPLNCNESADVDMDKSDSESDADVEDNAEGGDDVVKGLESGYNSDKIDNSSPDLNNRGVSPEMRVDDSGVPSPAIGMLSASHGISDNSPASSEANIDMGSPIGGQCSPEEDNNEFNERPESRLSFVNNKNVDLNLSKLSLLNNDGDSSKINTICGDSNKMEDDDYFQGATALIVDNKDEKMCVDEEEGDLYTNTISARYQCEDGEYSIQSCLNQFTACELMTGNNKVSCELCTKRHGGAEKKTVYTTATKQLLIYNPPAVLILHLKRFQVYRFRSAKVPKFVRFPMTLDLAPFCSKRSQSLPTFEVGQTKVLYSLYGVVEHSGSIHGGHYVAYVKVRPKIEENNYRWQFLPKNQREKGKGGARNRAEGEPEAPGGKWYYISDSFVSEAEESKVLAAQAYLLFYERIL